MSSESNSTSSWKLWMMEERRCKLCATLTFLSTHAPKKKREQLLPCWQVQRFPDSTEAPSDSHSWLNFVDSLFWLQQVSWDKTLENNCTPTWQNEFLIQHTWEELAEVCSEDPAKTTAPRCSPPELAGGHTGIAICWKRQMSLPTIRLLPLQARQESQAFPSSIAL